MLHSEFDIPSHCDVTAGTGMVSPAIMIAEDSRSLAAAMRVEFEEAGYRVLGVHATGEALLKAMARLNESDSLPEVVFMDIELAGELDGIETSRRLLRQWDVAVIYLTGADFETRFEKAMRTDPAAYLIKPFDFRQAMAMIEISLRQLSLMRQLKARQAELEAANLEKDTRYRVIFESSPDAVLLLDDGQIIDCNQAALDTFGSPSKSDLYLSHSALFPPSQLDGADSGELVSNMTDEARKTGIARYEFVYRRLEGSSFFADVVMTSFSLQGHAVLQINIRDVTERKMAQRELLRLHADLHSSHRELEHAYDVTIEGWAKALELRDEETEGHSRRVVEMTLKLAAAMGMDDEELEQVQRGAVLHDVGKMGVPDNILLKPGPLDDNEWDTMRQHPQMAHDWLADIDYLAPALAIPYCHHERWDGSGYPQGLSGHDIPLPARIFAVVDVFDALCSNRPYRQAWSRQEAIDHIRDQAGKQFDPAVVRHFLDIMDTEET